MPTQLREKKYPLVIKRIKHGADILKEDPQGPEVEELKKYLRLLQRTEDPAKAKDLAADLQFLPSFFAGLNPPQDELANLAREVVITLAERVIENSLLQPKGTILDHHGMFEQ